MKWSYPAIMALLVTQIFLGCSSSDEKENMTAAEAYESALEYEKEERYEEAIEKFTDVKNKHPYSRYAIEAELKVADIHYLREAWVEAQGAYLLFKELHPKHSRGDYVTFRLALSYYNQLPETVDRDLSVAKKAILYFDELISSYRNSAFFNESHEKRTDTLKKLAGKEFYIADFYFQREKYESALGRFEDLLKKYSKLGYDPQSLHGAAISAAQLGNLDKAKKFFSQLKSQHPEASEVQSTRDKLKEYGIQ